METIEDGRRYPLGTHLMTEYGEVVVLPDEDDFCEGCIFSGRCDLWKDCVFTIFAPVGKYPEREKRLRQQMFKDFHQLGNEEVLEKSPNNEPEKKKGEAISKKEKTSPEEINNQNTMNMQEEKKSNVEQFKAITEKMADVYERKNHDYGNSFDQSLDKFGLVASVVRIGDKMNRIESLMTKDAKVAESIEDTLLDMANYCIMTKMWLENKRTEHQ